MTEPQPALFPAAEIPALPPGMSKMGPKRPSSRDPAMVKMAATEIATRLHAMSPGDFGSIDYIVSDLMSFSSWERGDGFRFASYLESQKCWDCDFAIAECLNDFSSVLHYVVSGAEAVWATENDIQPPFPDGTRVRFGAETGTIDCVYEHGVAKYKIAVDGATEADKQINRRRLVNFEDVTAIGATD